MTRGNGINTNQKTRPKYTVSGWIDKCFPFLKKFKIRLILFFVLMYGPILLGIFLDKILQLSKDAMNTFMEIYAIVFCLYVGLVCVRRLIIIIEFFAHAHHEKERKIQAQKEAEETRLRLQKEAEERKLALERQKQEEQEELEKKRQELVKKEENERLRRVLEMEKQLRRSSQVEERLRSLAEGVAPQGDDMFTLDGQKQLYAYACEVFPPALDMASDPHSPAYALGNRQFDNPADILSCLSELMTELSQAIEETNLDVLTGLWEGLDTDTLIRGYKTFRFYQEMSMGSDSFALFCSYLADQFAKRTPASDD